MSHKIPVTPLPSSGIAQFSITADVGSITVSGAFSLLGNGVCSTFTSGSSAVYVTGTAGSTSLLINADIGQAAPSGGILNFTAPTVSNNFATISGTGNTITVTTTLVPTSLGGTGRNSLLQYGLLYGDGSNPVGLVVPGTNGQVLLGSTLGPPKFSTITSTGGTLSFTPGPNSLNIEASLFGSSFFNPLQPGNGGTGRTVLTSHGVIIGEGSNAVNVTPAGTNGQALIAATGQDPKFSTISSTGNTISFTFGPNTLAMDINWSKSSFFLPLPVSDGGTGRTVLTSHGVLIGEGSNPVNVTAPGTNGQVLIASTNGDPAFATIASNTLTFHFSPNSLNIDVNFAKVSFSSNIFPVSDGGTGLTILTAYGVLVGEGSLNVQGIAAGTDGQAFLGSSTGDPAFSTITSTGGTLTFSFGHHSLNIDVNFQSTFFYPLNPGSGGSGQTVLTSHGVLIGEGSLEVHVAPAGTNGQAFLASSTGDPQFATITSTGGTLTFSFGPNSLNIDINFQSTLFSPLNPGSGGTGQTVLTAYGILIGEGSNAVHVTPPGTNGQVLIAATNADPQFSTITSTGNTLTFSFGVNALNMDINLSSLSFFRIFTVGSGGTGRTALTTYGVLVGEGSKQINAILPGTDGQVLLAATGADPKFATITSSGLTLTFAFGPNFLSIDAVNTTGLAFVANSGIAIPSGGILNVLGDDPLTTVGSASVLAIKVSTNGSFFNPLQPGDGGLGQTILTTYGVLIGEGSLGVNVTAAGTDGQTLIAATGADPLFATITSLQNTLSFVTGHNSLNLDVNLSGIPIFNPLPPSNGGTGQTVLTAYGVLIGEGSNDVHVTAAGTNGQTLIAATGADPQFSTISSTGNTINFTAGPSSLNIDVNLSALSLFSPLPVSQGGLGSTLLTIYGVLIGEGSLEVHAAAPGTDGQAFLAATGADPAFSTITSFGNTLTFTFGHHSLNIEANLSSLGSTVLPVINGSTGRSLLTAYGVLIGEGSNPVDVTAAGTDGQVLISATGADPAFTTITSIGGTLSFTFGHNSLNFNVNLNNSFFNPISPGIGGTGVTLLTTYGVLIGEGSLDVNVTAAGTNGQGLIAATGADPSFSTITSPLGTLNFKAGPNSLNIDINLSNSFLIPLPVPVGGTGEAFLTANGVLIGEGTLPINATAAGTDGQTLIASSAGDPAFATISSVGGTLVFTAGHNALNMDVNPASLPSPLTVPSGGTGLTAITPPYAVLCAGANPTDAVLTVSPIGTVGQVLTSNGPLALPSFQNTIAPIGFNQINIQTFTSNGTYTPTPGLLYCTIQCVGGGGGGGSIPSSTQYGMGGGGGGGGYAQGTFSAAAIGASRPVVIGAGGAAGSAGNSTYIGTSFGTAILAATGGGPGLFQAFTVQGVALGGAAGVGSLGNVNSPGQEGSLGWGIYDAGEQIAATGGAGGNSYFASGGGQVASDASPAPGLNGTGFGAGGGGAATVFSLGSIIPGGAGVSGAVYITEYI